MLKTFSVTLIPFLPNPQKKKCTDKNDLFEGNWDKYAEYFLQQKHNAGPLADSHEIKGFL